MSDALHFKRILPGSDLTSAQVVRFLQQLSAPSSPRPLVFETWACGTAIVHLLGCAESGGATMRALVSSHLPGARMVASSRPEVVDKVARLRLTPKAMPLRDDALEAVLHAIYGVLAGRAPGETIAVQVVCGRGRRPTQVPTRILDPASSIPDLVVHGPRVAPSETRHRIVRQVGQARLDVTVRVAVTASSERSQQIRDQLLSALAQLEAPGARLILVNDSPSKWQRSTRGHCPLSLTPLQLTGLLAWPLDELDLPGLPPRHPRLIAPPGGIEGKESVFARTTAVGVDTAVGMSPQSRLLHLAITGGTGSGKSEVLAHLVGSDIAAGRPVVVVEPKRQLVDAIIERAPREAVGRIVVIDAAEDNPVGFNPLDVGQRDPGPVVDGILEVLKTVFTDGWGPRTEELMLTGLLSLVADGHRRAVPHTLLDLPLLLADDGYRRSVITAVAHDAVLAGYWAAFNELSPATRASIVAAPLNKLRKYVLRKNVAAVLGQAKPRIRIRDVWKHHQAILVPLNDALIGPGASQLLGGLIVAEVWLATQERAAENDPRQRPGFVFIDEVQRYLHLPTSIDDALATSRSMGVGWHLAFQGRGQVPAGLADAIELNARNQITFAASPKDATALAKTTTALTPEDFQSLTRFHIYANLVVDGAPGGWFSAHTQPPAPARGHAQQIRAAYRHRFAGDSAVRVTVESVPPVVEPDRGEPGRRDPQMPSHQRRRRP